MRMRFVPLTLVIVVLSSCSASRPAPPPAAAVSVSPSPSTTRPGCLTPDEGRYLPVAGPDQPTHVLVLGTGTRGVVVGAQANGGICQTVAFARGLASQGYHVAVFDWMSPYPQSMAAATKTLLADGAQQVVLGGFSRGGLVALGLSATLQKTLGRQIVGAFSVSGGPSAGEGYPTVASLSRFDGPILLVSSAEDPVFPIGTTAAIAKAHPGRETVLMVPGTGHALSMLDGADGPAIQTAIETYLKQRLPA